MMADVDTWTVKMPGDPGLPPEAGVPGTKLAHSCPPAGASAANCTVTPLSSVPSEAVAPGRIGLQDDVALRLAEVGCRPRPRCRRGVQRGRRRDDGIEVLPGERPRAHARRIEDAQVGWPSLPPSTSWTERLSPLGKAAAGFERDRKAGGRDLGVDGASGGRIVVDQRGHVAQRLGRAEIDDARAVAVADGDAAGGDALPAVEIGQAECPR